MANMLIAYPNFIDSTYYEVLFSGGSYAAASPLTNLADPLLSKQAISSNALRSSTKFQTYLGVARNSKGFILPKHNISKQGRARVKSSSVKGFSGVALSANADPDDTSISVEVPFGSRARIKTGDLFRIDGDETVYTATSDLNIGIESVYCPTASDRLLDDAVITWVSTNDNIIPDIIEAPDGSSTGAKLITFAEEGTQLTLLIEIPNAPSNDPSTLCASIYLKKSEYSRVRLRLDTMTFDTDYDVGTYGTYIDIDLENGTIRTTDSEFTSTPSPTDTYFDDTGNYHSSGIYPVGDDWYRCFITRNIPSRVVGSVKLYMYILNNGEIEDFPFFFGDPGQGGVYAWGFNIDFGVTVPAQYQPTGGIANFITDAAYSGSFTVEPAIVTGASSGASLTCYSGDFWSFEPDYFSDYEKVWQRAYAYGTLPFGHPSFGDGLVSQEETQLYSFPYVKIFDHQVNSLYWLCEIDDESNPDGCIKLSRCFIGSVWTPEFNIDFGASIGWEDDTDVTKSLGGAEFYNNISKGRRLVGSLTNMSWDEGLQNPFDIQRLAGISKQMFVMMDKEDSIHLHRRSMLCTFRTLSQLEFPNYDRTTIGVEFKEVRG